MIELIISLYRYSTWSYDPLINSWIRLPLRVQPTQRYYTTANTWCNTSVIVFGGIKDGIARIVLNETWLFDGVTETWTKQDVKLWRAGNFVAPRFGHTAVVLRQPLSNCTCQESILVYGGVSDYAGNFSCRGDLWELRCIVDSNGKQQFYWIFLPRQGNALWPPTRLNQRAGDFNKRLMYMWGGTDCDLNPLPPEGIWEYDLTSSVWKHRNVTNRLPQICSFNFSADVNTKYVSSFFYSRLNSIVTFSSKCTYALKSLNETFQFDFIHVNQDPFLQNALEKSCAVGGENIFCFTFLSSLHDVTVIRRVDYDAKRANWQWITIPGPGFHMFIPGHNTEQEYYHFAGTSFYHGKNIDNKALYVRHENITVGLSLWQFDLHIQSWFQTWHSFAPLWKPQATYSTINGSIIVVYSPLQWSPSSVTKHIKINNNTMVIWLFYTTIRRWTLCLGRSNQSKLPTPRTLSTIVDLKNGSLLLFGGLGNIPNDVDDIVNTDFNDLWRADMCDQKEYLPLRENCVRWVQLTGNNSHYPSPRHAHFAFVSSGSLFVFGGERLNINGTLTDMWQFEVNQLKWKEVKQKGFTPLGLCQPHTTKWRFATWGTKVAILKRREPIHTSPCKGKDLKYTFTFDVRLSTWSRQAKAPSLQPIVMTFWNGKLVVLGRPLFIYLWNVFTFLNPSCKVGQSSGKWENESCESCPKGSYAALGAQQCSMCPNGLTTSNKTPTSLVDCMCRDDYCDNGQCIIAVQAKQRSAVCQCKPGYTGSTCTYPTYYLVGAAAVGVLLLVTFLVLFIKRMIKYRRAKKNIEEELTSAHKVWNIHCKEITLKERIDGETPGSYGEVYKGIYRDMTVAVKHLSEMMFSDQTIKKEFEREVEVMRGIRHPNIIMFFGAGEVEKEERGTKVFYPFLVIEFMKRGTLKKILDSSEVSLTYSDKLSFALDTAKGMQYLHALSPPRIHRDMKSANLLVSRSWVVKVSDFGSARVVRREGERQPINISRSHYEEESADSPLLVAELHMTRNTGTILWRPPEIFALQNYGTSADVYRYISLVFLA